MTTQAPAPTEEMRERARGIIAALAYDPDIKGKDAELVARALAEQDRLAVERERERCAKWHDEQAHNLEVMADAKAEQAVGDCGYDYQLLADAHTSAATAIRAQGEK